MESGALLNKRYQLLEQLGAGGMSNVYRARDLMLERNIAIKVLHEKYSQDPAFQERFKMEARAAANLSHPNIVTSTISASTSGSYTSSWNTSLAKI